jgi:predicted nucleic acid-binding protein
MPSNPAAEKRPKVMVDATVLFAGIGWPRWSYEVLRHALSGDYQLVLSSLVIEQARRNLEKKLPVLIDAFDAWLNLVPFELVNDPKLEEILENRTLVRDISDVPIALAAMAAGVDYLVSEDKDLTDKEATRELHQRLTVIRPVIFLREVMGWSKEDLENIRHRSWLQG